MRVLIFGDSITYGRLDNQGGWANRLRFYYDSLSTNDPSHALPSIYNLGIPGDTAQGILKRFEVETTARNSEDVSFVIAIGTNDSALDDSKPRFTESRYQKNLEDILKLAKKYSDKTMFIGLLPVLEELTTPIPWRPERHYINKRILAFDGIMQKVAADNKLAYLPLFEIFQDKTGSGEDLFPDGLHPNNEGHELIFQLVLPELDRLLVS